MPCIESIMAVVRTINFQLRFNPQRTESFDERCLLREGVRWTPNTFRAIIFEI